MRQESVLHRPPPALGTLVADAVGYRHEGLTPGVHRGLPSPALTLVLPLDEPLVLAAHPDPRQPPDRYAALVGGLHTRPALIATGTRQFGLQLSLTPAGARALLGVPAAALSSLDAHLADVVGAAGDELVDRVRTATSWPARFAAVEAVLGRLLRDDSGTVAPELTEAWRLTTVAGGRLPAGAIADRVGWSPRHLRHRFRAEFGLSPKEAARVARFDQARRRLGAAVACGRHVDLAGLATACGYADQAHMTRDWTAHSGLPPRRWLAAERDLLRPDADDRRFVQDAGPPAAAGSRA